jgi:hypothetical protein
MIRNLAAIKAAIEKDEYRFGIDPTARELEETRAEMIKHLGFNPPPSSAPDQMAFAITYKPMEFSGPYISTDEADKIGTTFHYNNRCFIQGQWPGIFTGA